MELHHGLLLLGGLFILGLAADEIGRRTRLPRVTLLILLGFWRDLPVSPYCRPNSGTGINFWHRRR
jgi:hypothetical protein